MHSCSSFIVYDPKNTNKKDPPKKEGLSYKLLLKEGLVVGRCRLKCLDLSIDDLAHLPDPFQVWIDVAFTLLVKNPLTVEEYFHNALSARGNGNGSVLAVVPEKFVRHPRGDSVVLSTYAVGNFYLKLSFHLVPPSSPRFS